jgi:hypothetical protein
VKAAFLSPFSRKTITPPRNPPIVKAYNFGGVIFRAPAGWTDEWLRKPLDFPGQESMVSFLAQVEEEGFAHLFDQHLLLSWDSVYQLAVSENYRSGLSLIGLPPTLDWRPRLESQGGLGDKEFAIVLAGWTAPSGEKLQADLCLNGAVVTWKGEDSLLSRETWLMVQEIAVFHHRWPDERTADSNRRGWAMIRKHAIAARADLSHFLRSTVVLTPEKLCLHLRKGDVGGSALVEVIPDFAGAPARWIDFFDRNSRVLERYDIPHGEGITQVLLPPQMQSVLREIKAMPGRRVAGSRAEAFVRNPFATLGPDAAAVIDPAEFDLAREEAGISFARFTPELIRGPQGVLTDVALNIEESGKGSVAQTELRFATTTELAKFVARLGERIAQEAQCCFWNGHELEILGDTQQHLDVLQQALAEWRRPQACTLDDFFDLSQYSQRIEGFGVEKPYYSPFITKRDQVSAWFPEEVSYGVTYRPDDGSGPIAIPLDETVVGALFRKLEAAKREGAASIVVPGLPGPIPLTEADRIVSSFQAAQSDLGNRRFNPENLKPIKHVVLRKQLVVRSNLDTVEYEELRGSCLHDSQAPARLPRTLKPEFPLKQHQLEGLRWLQHLWAHSPTACRGGLLADDMGLGKTIQILAFIAGCLEADPVSDPFLIVAPVSLLENWKEEIDKFFAPGALPVLSLYGPVLAQKRLSREAAEASVGQMGIGKLLVRDWIGNARIVLTTYETLRDLEFSLARQKWSAMICDEAQKIKNPNSMVSRAAKKQNARFKIACTGTPVENTLTDLWCLFDFIQPGLLGALAAFGHRYKRPIEAETVEEKARVDELRRLIEPQKLRRTKAEVAKDLPAKILVDGCRKLVISMPQRALYAKAVHQFRHPEPDGKGQSFSGALGLLMYLRVLCTDPRPAGVHPADDVTVTEIEAYSPKMAWLLAELPKIRARQEKAIIFCEFRHLQRTLQRAVGERLQVIPDIINGQTSAAAEQANNRQHRIRAFQEKPGFGVIILSPLAVGFGLNMQAANHVIHFTRSWNPAKEDQATDRAYRIGQTRAVYVYYPVVTAPDFETFDARLDELLEWKRELSRDMLNGAPDLLPNDFGAL